MKFLRRAYIKRKKILKNRYSKCTKHHLCVLFGAKNDFVQRERALKIKKIAFLLLLHQSNVPRNKSLLLFPLSCMYCIIPTWLELRFLFPLFLLLLQLGIRLGWAKRRGWKKRWKMTQFFSFIFKGGTKGETSWKVGEVRVLFGERKEVWLISFSGIVVSRAFVRKKRSHRK